MRTARLMLVSAVCVVVVLSVGCQSGLSQSEVVDIVREEVERQLASDAPATVQQEVARQLASQGPDDVSGIVRTEVAKQLADLDELTLSTLQIVDEEGKIAARLYTTDAGQTGLFLTDASGGRPVKLYSGGEGGGYLELMSSGGTVVLSASEYESGLMLWNDEGKQVATLQDTQYGADLTIKSSDGNNAVWLGIDPTRAGFLQLYNNLRQLIFSTP